MYKPKCIRNGLACDTHKTGKYAKWRCGVDVKLKSSIDYRKKLNKCESCKRLCLGKYCIHCYGKFNTSHLKGKKLPNWWKKRISDGHGKQENSFFWKGEKATYSTKHKWIVRFFGNPKKCSNCNVIGKQGRKKWTIEWANISGEYKRDRQDYKPLCVKCHAIFDGKTKNINDYEHGSNGKYRHGCRCVLCKKYKKLYRNKLINCHDIVTRL